MPDEIKKSRLDKSLPVIHKMSEWIKEQLQDQRVPSGNAIGKAIRHSAERWDELSNYLYDGKLEIDNMIYSFFAICKKHEVNPYEWLRHTLISIMTINHKNIRCLYPQNFKSNSSII